MAPGSRGVGSMLSASPSSSVSALSGSVRVMLTSSPSLMVSPSVSGLKGSVPMSISTESRRPSPSESTGGGGAASKI